MAELRLCICSDDDMDFEFQDDQSQGLVRRRVAEDMLVCPWSFVIYNIDVSQRDSKKGIQIGMGKIELKRYLANFKPAKVHVFWGPKGHQGLSVLQFGTDWSGLRDAQALEKTFLDSGHGRRDYERNTASKNLGKELYGWIAGEKDLKGGSFGSQGTDVAMYLETYGNLVGASRAYDQQVFQLAYTVATKDLKNVHLKTEMFLTRSNAEAEMLQLKELHELEVESFKVHAQKSTDEYNQMVRQLSLAVSEKDEKNLNFETQMDVIRRNAEADRLQQQEAHKRELEVMSGKIKKFEGAYGLVLDQYQDQGQLKQSHAGSLKLVRQQEMSFSPLKIKKEKEQQINKIDDLEKQLEELENTQEFHEHTIHSLVLKERKANDEIADGQKMAAQVLEDLSEPDTAALIEVAVLEKHQLDKTGQTQQKVELRRVGAIDSSHWQEAFRRKFGKDDDWEVKMTKSLSRWADTIRNPKFQPYKRVRTGEGDDDWKQEIDHSNKQLISLKKELGICVYNSVTTALLEIEEYNASGRFPIPVAWISEQQRKATLEEVIVYLGEVIEALVANITPPTKRIRR